MKENYNARVTKMRPFPQYLFEQWLIAATMLLTIAGFWNIYFGQKSAPNAYHHLHVVTDFIWLLLLLYQLRLIVNQMHAEHRRVGLAVLIIAPLVFATTALLTVHSAHKGIVSGQGDALIVQNVMVTLELGMLILLAFVLRRRRILHGSILLSTTILFMGIALFFTLISFVPHYKIEGPETFYRFESAGVLGQIISIVVGLLFFLKDRRHGWPFLLAGSSFLLNEFIRSLLTRIKLIQPLTEYVGSLNETVTFVGSFAVLLALLAATGILNTRNAKPSRLEEKSQAKSTA